MKAGLKRLAISSFFVLALVSCGGPGGLSIQGALPLNGGSGNGEASDMGSDDEGAEDEAAIGPSAGPSEVPPGGQAPAIANEPIDIPVTIAKIPEILNPLLISIQIEDTDAGEMMVPMGIMHAVPSPRFQSFLQIRNLANGIEKRAKVEENGSFSVPLDPEEENLTIPLFSRDDVIVFTPYKGEEAQLAVTLHFEEEECVWSWEGGEMARNDCGGHLVVIAIERPVQSVLEPLPPQQIQPFHPGDETLPDALLLNHHLDRDLEIPGMDLQRPSDFASPQLNIDLGNPTLLDDRVPFDSSPLFVH